jgi:hypothetical protein
LTPAIRAKIASPCDVQSRLPLNRPVDSGPQSRKREHDASPEAPEPSVA